jgi:hypothetical protein
MLVALLVAGACTGGDFIGGRAFNESEVVTKRQRVRAKWWKILLNQLNHLTNSSGNSTSFFASFPCQ